MSFEGDEANFYILMMMTTNYYTLEFASNINSNSLRSVLIPQYNKSL